MKAKIREFCGDYALDLEFPHETVTLYFKSYQNALNVKRIIEIDESVPNVATVADFVEVIRCKDCKHFTEGMAIGMCKRIEDKPIIPIPFNHFCRYGDRKCEDV